jgi:hypothetical protein
VFFAHHDDSKQVNRRLLHDALNEKFHHKGGLGYLYRLLSGDPIVQRCRLSRLEAPAGSVDRSKEAPHNLLASSTLECGGVVRSADGESF